MALIFRGQSRRIALLLSVLSAVCAGGSTSAQLYDQPQLIVDPGMHTAPIRAVSVDAEGRLAVTGSDDKTVRVWSLTDGKLQRTIRMPAGPGNIGRIYAVAMSPDSDLIAVGGWTKWTTASQSDLIYFIETRTGKIVKQISVPNSTLGLAFSHDGRYLASGVNSVLYVYDRDQQWNEVFNDKSSGDSIHGLAFSSDGRLAVASLDGKIRLYDRNFKLSVPPKEVTDGKLPLRIVFSPDGDTLAVAYEDAPTISLYDGHSLAQLRGPNLGGLIISGAPKMLSQVAFSKDGATLYAGGGASIEGGRPVLAWAEGGRGKRRVLQAGLNTVADLASLPDGGILIATQDPLLKVLDKNDTSRWVDPSPNADLRDQEGVLAASSDGTVVDFGFEQFGKSPLRFDLHALKLSRAPPKDDVTHPASQLGLDIRNWKHEFHPTVDGKPITLRPYEMSRSLSVESNGNRFVLGAEYGLRAFDARGRQLWESDTPSIVWGVDITEDGRLVVGAYGDGTIRWRRMDDGRELLALFVLRDQQNWVAWTPEGFYGASPGAFGVLQWQVNRGFDAAPETVPVSAITRLKRPDALPLVLQEMETARALGIADVKAARRDVQIVTGSAKAPGSRLHVLTIGVSDYGERAKDLTLKFAVRDAQDVANALVNTQDGGLYAAVELQYLHNDTANRAGIFDALDVMQRNMEKSTGGDLAVIMFSGHGTVIDGQFYLVPYGVDNSTPARRKSVAIAASEFQSEISKLAKRGRVLVLLDACRSEGLIGTAVRGADVLRSVLADSNVTVLTSSTADKLSREDEKWQHGAFTKDLLDALGAGDDIDADRNGVISMAELTAYLARHLDELTGGDQQLGLEQRFQGDVFVSGL
jgi:WD40 repeat protein